MDDLESFFYVLCWICCGYSAPGKKIEDFSSTFGKWEHPNAQEGAGRKSRLFLRAFSRQLDMSVTDYFGDVVLTLVVSLHRLFQLYLVYNEDFDGQRLPPTLDSAMETILGHVKTALACVEADEAADSVVRSAENGAPPATLKSANPQSISLMDPPHVYSTRARSCASSSKRGYDESSEGDENTFAKKRRPHPHESHHPSALDSLSPPDDKP